MAKSRKKTQFAIKFSSSWPELWWLLAWKKKKKLSSSKVFVMWSGFCRKSAYQIQQLEYQFQCLGGLLKEWDQFSLCLSAAIGVSARFFQALSLAKFHVIGLLRWFLPVSVRAMAGDMAVLVSARCGWSRRCSPWWCEWWHLRFCRWSLFGRWLIDIWVTRVSSRRVPSSPSTTYLGNRVGHLSII